MGTTDTPATELLDGRYRLVEKLGAGGMSVVWRGYDEILGRQVAVKVLAPRLSADRNLRRRLRIEAQAAARLSHPHITNVYDYGESTLDDGGALPYVVMELIEGEPLSEVLARVGQLPWPVAVATAAEIAAALAAAHARGIVHRDVTPGNVLLTAAGVKVLDFGISAVVGESDIGPDGSLLGTPAYLAPERLDGGQVSPATDVYALGLLLYEMLSGQLPWPSGTITQMLRAHVRSEPAPMPPVDGLPADVVELCGLALAKRPGERPSSAEMARVLAGAAATSGGAAVPVSPAADGPPTVDPAEAKTTILRWNGATGATAALAVGRSRAVERRTVRRRDRRGTAAAAAVAAGLLAVVAVGWQLRDDAETADRPAVAGPQVGGAPPAPQAGGAPPAPVCAVSYALRQDNGRTFTAALRLTNTAGEPVAGWRLTFTLPGDQTVTAGAPARLRQAGRVVAVQPRDADAALAAGAATTVTLTGRYARTNPLPVTFQLDGRACAVTVSGVAGRPTQLPVLPGASTTGTVVAGAPDVGTRATPGAATPDSDSGNGKKKKKKKDD